MLYEFVAEGGFFPSKYRRAIRIKLFKGMLSNMKAGPEIIQPQTIPRVQLGL
jgi:hypothetical protein